MTEEKKGFPFFKLLFILFIIAGLGLAGVWYFNQMNPQTNWTDYLKTQIQKTKKSQSDTKPVPTPSVNPDVITENSQPKAEVSEDQPIVSTTQEGQSAEKTIATKPEVKKVLPSEEKKQEVVPSALPDTLYTWQDFITGKKCLTTDQFITQNSTQIDFIRSACQNQKIWGQWLHTFREDKKTLLIQTTMKEKSKYLKYLKVIPYLLFDMHNTQNKNSDIHGTLDQIETAILNRQPQKVLNLMTNIQDANMQLDLHNTLLETEKLIKIQNLLEQNTVEEITND